MAERGYEIIGEPCRTTACGRRTCPLFKRKAVKLATLDPIKAGLDWFDSIKA